MWLMKTLLTSGCTNQRGAGQLRYLEEALAETIGLLRARGMSAEYIVQGFKFPLGNTYEITFSLLRQEVAGMLLGPVTVGGVMYSVWYGAQQ